MKHLIPLLLCLLPFGTAAQNNTTRFIRPPYLHHGDTVGIVSPAGKLPQKIDTAKIRARFEAWGLHPKFGQFWDCRKEPYFAATDRQRAEDLQRMIDDPSVKAILARTRRVWIGAAASSRGFLVTA